MGVEGGVAAAVVVAVVCVEAPGLGWFFVVLSAVVGGRGVNFSGVECAAVSAAMMRLVGWVLGVFAEFFDFLGSVSGGTCRR
jgi:hypothetical protein